MHTHTACLPLLKCLSPPASTCLSTDWDDRVGPFYRLRHTSVSSTFTQSQLWGLGNLCFRRRDKGGPSVMTLRFSGHIYKGLAPSVCGHCHPSVYFFIVGLLFYIVSHWGSRFLPVSLHMKVLITWTAVLLPEKLVEIIGFSLAGIYFL